MYQQLKRKKKQMLGTEPDSLTDLFVLFVVLFVELPSQRITGNTRNLSKNSIPLVYGRTESKIILFLGIVCEIFI